LLLFWKDDPSQELGSSVHFAQALIGIVVVSSGKYVVVLFDNGNLDISGMAAVGRTRFSNEIVDAVAATIAAPLRHMVLSVLVAVAVVVVAIVVVAVVEEGRANGSTNHCGWRFAKLGTNNCGGPSQSSTYRMSRVVRKTPRSP
jgi:uncharacterized membrane protein